MTKSNPRIAILGFALESNRFAPVVSRLDFQHLEGQTIVDEARKPAPRVAANVSSFIATMDAAGPWTPVPIVLANGGAAGPVDQKYFDEIMDTMHRGLKAAMPLDGVYFSQHGAALSTGMDSPDAEMFAAAREVVGPGVPIVATLDLHGNVSERMVTSTDLLIGYITNPHVDMRERGIEAAKAMQELLQGARFYPTYIKLPMVAPSVTLLTARGPYADLINLGQSRLGPDIVNVTVMGGFAWADAPVSGLSVVVTSRRSAEPGRKLALEIAAKGWAERHRYVPNLTSLDDAVAMMVANGSDPKRPAQIFADVSDNPGGGGRGNTTWILAAAHKAGAKGVLISPFHDPELAAEAHRLGCGKTFRARFNRAERNEFSKPFEAEAAIRTLCDGVMVGRRGTGAGRTIDFGPSATLELGGISVVVTTGRSQALDTGYFERFGLSVDQARSVVVKSRGHFRAGFDHIFPPDRTIEVDCPGLVSQRLERFAWQRLPRPIFPLDRDMEWQPAA
jgi:microcystin degradation protein MlrC